MAGKSQMLPASRVNPERTRMRNHAEQTNNAFADAFALTGAQMQAEKGNPDLALYNAMLQAGVDPDTGMPVGSPAKPSTLPPITVPADLGALGRNGDTMVAHINPAEAELLKRSGGSGTINPATGLPEFGGGGGTINGAGGSGNVSGGGRGNAGGGGFGNTGKGEQSRTNDRLGKQQSSWGNRPTTSYGAPGNYGKYGTVALGPKEWSALNDQVDAYNDAANKWNAGAGRSLANFANEMGFMGLHMIAPDLSRPATYTGGNYHLGLNPAELAGGLIGGAIAPGGGIIGGTLAGKVYDMAGGKAVMLGGPDVPGGWQSGLGAGLGSNQAPQSGSTSSNAPPSSPAGGKTENSGGSLLPQINGAGSPAPGPAAPLSQPAAQLPAIAYQQNPGAYLPVAGPSPYGWTRPSWQRAA